MRDLAAQYREVVLSGINLGRWGREPGSTMRLADLVRRLLDETPIERLRLSSVEPMDWSDDLLEPDGNVAAHRQARARAAAIGLGSRCCAACIASIGRGIMPTAS